MDLAADLVPLKARVADPEPGIPMLPWMKELMSFTPPRKLLQEKEKKKERKVRASLT